MNPCITKLANSCARRHGAGKATEITFADVPEPTFVNHTRCGYRKKTTGEYVPRAYVMKSQGGGVYYQHAETTIAMPLRYQLLPDH